MRKALLLTAVVWGMGCGGSMHTETTPDPAMATEAEAFTREIFAHLERNDWEFIKTTACPEVVMYDIDPQGQPMAVRGREELNRFVDQMQQATPPGATMSSQITRLDCRPMIHAGVCYVEFDQTMTQNGQTMGPFKFRGTLVAEKHGDHWIWAHWHGSFRETPQMPAGAPEGAPAATPPAPPAN